MDLIDVLNKYGVKSTKEAKNIIRSKGAVASGSLLKDTEFELTSKDGEINLVVITTDYGKFIDQGVKGSESTYPQSRKSPYKYTTKMPPSSVIDRWIVKKGIAPRNDKGQFISRKGLNFVIRRSIKEKGIRAIEFTKPFFDNIDDLEKDLLKVVPENIADSIIGWFNDLQYGNNSK